MNRGLGQLLVSFLTLIAGIAEGSSAWKWTLQNGFDGSEILSMATDGRLLLAATRTRGVYRSLDSGRTWQPPAAALRLHVLEFDSATHRFYGLGDSTLYAADSLAREWVRLTDLAPNPIDGGPVDFSLPGRPPRGSFSVHGRIIILRNSQSGDVQGVQVSRDGGGTWRVSPQESVGLNILSVLAADSCVYASSTGNPVTVSCDGGATWRFVGGDSTTLCGYGLARHQGGVLVASLYGVFSSGNGGSTWVPRHGNLVANFDPGFTIVSMKSKGNTVYARTSVARDDLRYNQVLHRSRDGGVTWTVISDLEPNPKPWLSQTLSLEVAEVGSRVFLSTIRGVLRSTDGGANWTRARGLGDAEILTLAVQGRHSLALTGKGLFVTADSGATWEATLRNDSIASWTALSGGIGLFAVLSKTGDLRVSADSGRTWRPSLVPPGSPAYRLALLGSNLYLVSADGLWRSGPEGTTWTLIPLPEADTIGVMAGGSRSLLLGARRHVWEYREDGGFIGRNGSLTSFDIPRAWLVGENAYIVSQSHLHAWEPGKGDWRLISGYHGYPYSLTGKGSRLVMGTEGSPQISLDGGGSWEEPPEMPPSFPQVEVSWLPFTLALDGNQVFGGDGYGGIWKLDPALLDPTTATRGLPRRVSPGRDATGIRPLLEAWKVRLDGRAY